MSDDVYLRYTIVWNVVEVQTWIESVILRCNVDVVDVQKNSAICLFSHFCEKLPFGHFRDSELCVTAHILHADRKLQVLPHHFYSLGRIPGCAECLGNREQIVRVSSIHAAPAQVVGNKRSLRPLRQLLEAP